MLRSHPPLWTASYGIQEAKTISLLICDVEELWRENCGSVVLFLWINYLQEDLLTFLGKKNPHSNVFRPLKLSVY